MFGLIGLNEGRARLVTPSRSSRHLRKQLKGALGGARVAASQPQVSIDHADKGEIREIMPFCDELCADNEIKGPFGNLFEFAPQPFSAAKEIRRKHENTCIREQLTGLFCDAFNSGPTRAKHLFSVTLGTYARPLLDMSAVMAYERTTKTMFNEPGVALPTAKSMSATAA